MKAFLYVGAGGLAAMMPVAQGANGQTARPLSAFFGLDNALPARANLLCQGASGQVSFPGGHLVDPNRDLDPDTHVAVDSASSEVP